MTEEKTRIADVVGDEYKGWKAGDIILLTAPTGSGKSTFVLQVLLKWVIYQFKHHMDWHPIRYFVNRTLLKNQLQEEVHKLQLEEDSKITGIDVNHFISIETYQSIEERIKKGETPSLVLSRNRKGLKEEVNPNPVSYIVYDECHYFLADSTFNPSTVLSFEYLRRAGTQEIQIFMSATMGYLRTYLKEEYDKSKMNFFSARNGTYSHFRVTHLDEWNIKEYPKELLLKRKNDDINLYWFSKTEEIGQIIRQDSSGYKWLVFVGSKRLGHSLYSELKKKIKDTIFVDAEYDKQEKINEHIEKSIRDKSLPNRVVICTSVLDNGFSFIDEELRNIVLLVSFL